MVLEEVNYFIDGKKHKILAKKVSAFSTGLMFRRSPPPLLFALSKDKSFSIISLFCKPFRAIWLDENMKSTKVIDVKSWKWRIPGHGKYLLEIPLRTTIKK
jgi:uncharacterized membrane protein (UPF0127 family)